MLFNFSTNKNLGACQLCWKGIFFSNIYFNYIIKLYIKICRKKKVSYIFYNNI